MKKYCCAGTRILPILTFTLLNFFAQAQSLTYGWAKQMGGSSDDRSLAITVDKSGNIITTGHFDISADFDPGNGTFNLNSGDGNGPWDGFISKLDRNGNFVWAKQITDEGANTVEGVAITTDASGNIYSAGRFSTQADLDPGLSTYYLTDTLQPYDSYISKLDSNGNFIWAKKLGGNDVTFYYYSLKTDASGALYVSGNFKDTVDFDPGPGVYNQIANGQQDIFILKLDVNGNFLWAKQVGGVYMDNPYSLYLDGNNNLLISGSFQSSELYGLLVDFDPGPGVYNLSNGPLGSLTEGFLLKLDSSGAFVFARQFGGNNSDAEYGYSVQDDQEGNIYVSGYFTGTSDFDPGPGISTYTSNGGYDAFIVKLDPAGDYIWAKTIGGSSSDFAHYLKISSGTVYVSGSFGGTCDFDPGPGTFNLISAGGRDIYISLLDTAGNFIKAYRVGSSTDDLPTGIVLDSNNNLFMTGYFTGSVDFNPGSGTNTLSSFGDRDIFVLKLSQGTSTSVIKNEFDSKISLYPNPVHNRVTIDLGWPYENVSLFLFDVSGKLIRQTTYEGSQFLQTELDQPAGVYILRIVSGDKQAAFRLVKP